MKILGMGGFELVIILVVILLIFGPKNLPKLGSAIGKTVSNLRSGMNDGKKKKDAEEEKPATEEAAGEADAKPVEIEGEVEAVEDVEEPGAEGVGESAAKSTEELVEESSEAGSAEPAVESPEEGSAEPAEAPKKVRRVVKKKVADGE